MFQTQFLLLFSLLIHEPARYGDYIFPKWADLVGWMMPLAEAICVPAYAIFALCCLQRGSFMQVRATTTVLIFTKISAFSGLKG